MSEFRACDSFLTNFVNELNSGDKSQIYSTFNSLSQCIAEKYTVESGQINMYHGNVYDYENCESHKLYKPNHIFNQRMTDLVNSNANPNSRTETKISTLQACYTDEDLRLEIHEHWRNGPVEWSFKLRNK